MLTFKVLLQRFLCNLIHFVFLPLCLFLMLVFFVLFSFLLFVYYFFPCLLGIWLARIMSASSHYFRISDLYGKVLGMITTADIDRTFSFRDVL
jgi:hypothetical protein